MHASKPFVPSELAFPCMPPKEGENPKIRKSRNPSNNNLKFPSMNANVIRHAQWNMRASWILRECLTRSSNTVFHQQGSNELRALEAALFMWGYDLGKNSLPANLLVIKKAQVVVAQPVVSVPGNLKLWGQPFLGSRVPASHNFATVIAFYRDFRAVDSGNRKITAFRDWLVSTHGFAVGAATAYCYPLRDREMSIRELSDNEVRMLADEGQGAYSKEFLDKWKGCDIKELPHCIADVYIAGCIAQLGLVGGAAHRKIMAWGFAGTPNAAQAILNVGRSLGKHFEFLDKQNQPTAYFV